MIAYLYNHFSGEYRVDMSTMDATAQSICEALRGGMDSGNSCFVYATTDIGKNAFLQYGRKGDYYLGYGICFDKNELKSSSLGYYDKLKYEADNVTDIKAELPTPEKYGYSSNSSFKSWDRLFDALLFSEESKQVAILVSNINEVKEIFSVLENLLPKNLLSSIGYSVSSKRIKTPIELNLNEGTKTSVRVKLAIILADASRDYDELESECIVFDNRRHKDNYKAELNKLSEVVTKLNFAIQTEVSGFQKNCEIIFKEGHANEKLMNVVASLYNLRSASKKMSEETAKKIFHTYCYAYPEYTSMLSNEQMMFDAFKFVYDNLDSASDETIKASLEANRVSQRANDAVSSINVDDVFVKYCANEIDNITTEEEQKCIDLIFKDKDCRRLDIFCRTVKLYKRLKPKFIKSFRILSKLLVKSYEGDNYWESESRYQKTIFGAFEYTDIKNLYELLDQKTRVHGEKELFDIANSFDNAGRNLVFAVLLSSAYNNVSSQEKAVRIIGFENAIEKLSNCDKIVCLVDVREKIVNIQERFLGIEKNSIPNFVVDDDKGNRWIRGMISKLSFQELVELDGLLYIGDRSYEGLIRLFNDRFLDKTLLNETVLVQTDRNFFSEIEALYIRMRQESNERLNEIDAIIDELNKLRIQDEASEELESYRCKFVQKWINTLSEDDHRHFFEEEGLAPFETATTKEKTKISQAVEDESLEEMRKIKQKVPRKFIFVRTFLFILLSGIILLIPPVVQGIVIDGFSIDSILSHFYSYIDIVLLTVPCVVLISHLLTYALLKKEKNERLIKSNISAFMCGIIPAVFFVISFLVFWFLDIELLSFDPTSLIPKI